MTSHGFILRPCRSLPGQVVRCDSVSLHAVSTSFIVRAFSGATHLLCPLLTSPRRSMPVARHFVACRQPTAVETSRGKTRHFRCTSAGFTKCIPTTADGGLRGHVPARPRCTTPHIRFLFIAPQLWIQLPSDPASRQRPCRSPSLRLCVNLAPGLAPG